MKPLSCVNPRYKSLISQSELDDLDRVMNWRGDTAGTHSSRDVCRITVDDEGEVVELYLKREWQTYLKDRFRNLREGLGWGIKSVREWHVLTAMSRAGIGCPEPVAMGQSGWWRPKGFLVLRSLTDAIEFKEYMRLWLNKMSTAGRHRLAAHLGREVARMHEAGIDHPDLFAKHIFFKPIGNTLCDRPLVYFIDMQRSRVRDFVPVCDRIRDLSSLSATITDALVGNSERMAFLKSYIEHSSCEIDLRATVDRVRRRTEKLRGRRKIREMLEAPYNHSAMYVPLRGRSLCANKKWVQPLGEQGLDSFDQVYKSRGGKVLRRLASRENVLVKLESPQGPVRGFLKRHRGWYPLAWLQERLLQRRTRQPGFYEAAQIIRLSRTNIETMELIAYGQKFYSLGRGESFVLTREVENARQLDDLLREDYSLPRSASQEKRLRGLIRQVAQIAKKFHRVGYNHQDFYCCHFLVREGDTGPYKIHLIDLQRVQYRRRFRTRWVIKDLGQLNYSAPAGIISRTDRLRFFLEYSQKNRLDSSDKKLIQRILHKTSKIARHDRRIQKRQTTIPIQQVMESKHPETQPRSEADMKKAG